MNIMSKLFIAIGLIVLVAGGVLLGKDIIDINQLWAVANANRSTSFFNPRQEVILTAGLAVLGGFLLGLGLSWLSRRRQH